MPLPHRLAVLMAGTAILGLATPAWALDSAAAASANADMQGQPDDASSSGETSGSPEEEEASGDIIVTATRSHNSVVSDIPAHRWVMDNFKRSNTLNAQARICWPC